MKRLSTVQRRLDSIDEINCGGCGISALAMYRWLKDNDKLVGDESFTFLYTCSDTSFSVNSKIIEKKSRKSKFNSASHIMLFHNGKVWDSEGNHVQYRYGLRHNNISEKLLLEALNFGRWNDSFDREIYLPKIQKQLGVDLSDVDIDHD